MTAKKIGNNIEIVCEVWNRGNNAWGHSAICLYNGQEVARASVRYYNRTWEACQFDTVKSKLMSRLDKEKTLSLSDRRLIALSLN